MLTGPSLPTPTGAHELTRQGPNPRLPHGQVDPLPLSSQGRPSKDLKTRYFKSPIFQLFFFGLHHAACGISGPRPGTAPRPPAGKALQPFDWTCFPLLSSVPSLSFPVWTRLFRVSPVWRSAPTRTPRSPCAGAWASRPERAGCEWILRESLLLLVVRGHVPGPGAGRTPQSLRGSSISAACLRAPWEPGRRWTGAVLVSWVPGACREASSLESLVASGRQAGPTARHCPVPKAGSHLPDPPH